MSRPTVLILSTNPAFARELAAHWPSDPNPPEFTVLEQALFRDLAGSNYDLAIADASSPASRSKLKKALTAAAKPAILVHSAKDTDRSPAAPREFASADCSIIELSNQSTNGAKPLWPVMAGFLGREILRRLHAEGRARDAEAICVAAQAEATLGRYMAEMRHNVNNALTSVLGNAELLTLEPGLPAHVFSQAETILSMALRLHEVFRRFSSLEEELSVAARPHGGVKETIAGRSAAAATTAAGK